MCRRGASSTLFETHSAATLALHGAVTSVVERLVYTERLIPDGVIRVFDEAGNVIETHEHAGDFKEW
jgi:hypothetical protein